MTNEGWADSVAKILGSSKPKNKKTLVLSRAKKHSEIVKKETEEKPPFEVVGEAEEVKTEVKKEENVTIEPPAKKKVCFHYCLPLIGHIGDIFTNSSTYY